MLFPSFVIAAARIRRTAGPAIKAVPPVSKRRRDGLFRWDSVLCRLNAVLPAFEVQLPGDLLHDGVKLPRRE